jgi:hypothetical protein
MTVDLLRDNLNLGLDFTILRAFRVGGAVSVVRGLVRGRLSHVRNRFKGPAAASFGGLWLRVFLLSCRNLNLIFIFYLYLWLIIARNFHFFFNTIFFLLILQLLPEIKILIWLDVFCFFSIIDLLPLTWRIQVFLILRHRRLFGRSIGFIFLLSVNRFVRYFVLRLGVKNYVGALLFVVDGHDAELSPLVWAATVLIFEVAFPAFGVQQTIFIPTFVLVGRYQAPDPFLLLQDVTEGVSIFVFVAVTVILLIFVEFLEDVGDTALSLILFNLSLDCMSRSMMIE